MGVCLCFVIDHTQMVPFLQSSSRTLASSMPACWRSTEAMPVSAHTDHYTGASFGSCVAPAAKRITGCSSEGITPTANLAAVMHRAAAAN